MIYKNDLYRAKFAVPQNCSLCKREVSEGIIHAQTRDFYCDWHVIPAVVGLEVKDLLRDPEIRDWNIKLEETPVRFRAK